MGARGGRVWPGANMDVLAVAAKRVRPAECSHGVTGATSEMPKLVTLSRDRYTSDRRSAYGSCQISTRFADNTGMSTRFRLASYPMSAGLGTAVISLTS